MQSRVPVGATMLCAGLLTAQFVAARAARDAIYLAHLDVTTLPQIVIATSVCSIGLVALSSISLQAAVAGGAGADGLWRQRAALHGRVGLARLAPAAVARVLYLHVSGLGPMLASGFWLIATESFDPHTAKKHFGRIAGAGTLGGLLGALLAERLAGLFDVSAILIMLAALNFVCAWQMRHPRAPARRTGAPSGHRGVTRALGRVRPGSVCVRSPPSRTSAISARWCFSARRERRCSITCSRWRRWPASVAARDLLRFFAAYYAGISVVTFVVQMFASRLGARKVRARGRDGDAVDRGAVRRRRRAARAGVAGDHPGARQRVGVSRLALPRGLRDLLHADRAGRTARRQVHHRRRLRPAWRRRRRRRWSGSRRCWPSRSNTRRSSAWPSAVRRWRWPPPAACVAATCRHSNGASSIVRWSSICRTSRTSRREPRCFARLAPDREPSCPPRASRRAPRRPRPAVRIPDASRRSGGADESPSCVRATAARVLRVLQDEEGIIGRRSCRTSCRCWPGTPWRKRPCGRCAAWRRNASASSPTRCSIATSRLRSGGGWRACSRCACRSAPPTG